MILQVPKKRKVVDRRASKGRKIRYTVMDKLVNFMVPQESALLEDKTPALFSNLFGQGSHASRDSAMTTA